MRKAFNERNKPFPDLQKILTTCGLAQKVMIQNPIFGNLAMQFPALFIRFVLEDATIIFTQGFGDLARQIERVRQYFGSLSGTQKGAGVDGSNGNIFQVLCQRVCLLFPQSGQSKRTLAVGNDMLKVRFTFPVPDEVEFHSEDSALYQSYSSDEYLAVSSQWR